MELQSHTETPVRVRQRFFVPVYGPIIQEAYWSEGVWFLGSSLAVGSFPW